ncbi:MAG: HAD-IC family P-type ATPase, partial [Lachnospiraceae bacterium]|nr:HAD-IC family P-type ATPase [Lachnospiraceae bacterium]
MTVDMYQGLTTAQAQEAVRLGLSNIGVDNTARTTGQIIRDNVLTYFNLIFAVLTVLLVIAGSYRSLTFLPVVIANTLIGIIQQLRAKKTLDRLAVLNQPVTCAIRDGAECRVPSDQLVPDDVIVLKEGNQIPADAVVLDGEIAVNESLLTGESDEIEKMPGAELMSGSFVVNGRCHARLTKVGMDSYINRLSMKAKQMQAGEQSEMVRSINRFVIAAGIAIIPIGALLLYQSFSRNLSFTDSVVSMVAAVIGMIPEGLYLLVSVTLVMSAMRLARNKVMLHDMKSTETLARVDILCVDKTGTITENRMRVTDAFLPGGVTDEQAYAHAQSLLASYAAALPDDNATMQAIRDYFPAGTRRRAAETLPFSSKCKYSAVTFDAETYVLG